MMLSYCAANRTKCLEKLQAVFNVVQFNLGDLKLVLNAHKSKAMLLPNTTTMSEPQLLLPIITF